MLLKDWLDYLTVSTRSRWKFCCVILVGFSLCCLRNRAFYSFRQLKMNLSDLDCPQFLSFESEAFKRDIIDPPTSPADSLNTSNHSCIEYEMMTEATESELVEGNESVQFNVKPSMEERNEHSCDPTVFNEDFENSKENFSIKKAKELPQIMAKSTFRKATIPQPFKFQTDNRIKSKPSDNFTYKEENFSSKLRKNTLLQSKKNHVTKVQPFDLTKGKKRKQPETEYKSLAEQVAAFQKKTPQRYHTSHKSFQPQQHWEPPTLTAKSPELQALKRRRVISALSKEEQEEKDILEMKAYEFHARPVDPKIYNQPSTDKTCSKFTTKTKQFHSKKVRDTLKRPECEKDYKFKAQPVPTNILNGPVGLKEKKVIPLTEAKAPTFESENRIAKRKLLEEKKAQEEAKEPSQKKMPKQPSGPPPVIPWVKKLTAVQPFSFDKMDKERYDQKDRKIQAEIENEKKPHVFRAQLMPSPVPSALPAVLKKPLTKPEPFNFVLNNKTIHHNITTEVNETFRAQPATVLLKKPFIPEKAPKPDIEIQEFTLYTDRRASEREHLKQLKEEEEKEKEQVRLLQKAKEEEEEHMELMKLRRDIVHKANPIRQYKPLEIKSGLIPLTAPESPHFETDKRLQAKHKA